MSVHAKKYTEYNYNERIIYMMCCKNEKKPLAIINYVIYTGIKSTVEEPKLPAVDSALKFVGSSVFFISAMYTVYNKIKNI